MNTGGRVEASSGGGFTFSPAKTARTSEASGFMDVFNRTVKNGTELDSNTKNSSADRPDKRYADADSPDRSREDTADSTCQNPAGSEGSADTGNIRESDALKPDSDGHDKKSDPKDGKDAENAVLLAALASGVHVVTQEAMAKALAGDDGTPKIQEAGDVTLDGSGPGTEMMQYMALVSQAADEGLNGNLKPDTAAVSDPAKIPDGEVLAGAAEQAADTSKALRELGAEVLGASKEDGGKGEDAGQMFSDSLKDQAEVLKSMGRPKGYDGSDMSGQKSGEEPEGQEGVRKADGGRRTFAENYGAEKQAGEVKLPVLDNGTVKADTSAAVQIKEGLAQAVKQDLTEFTIRLKPEGLGEIVVHMANAGGKLLVRLGVSNAETERLINSQMMNLKELLEPLHAQVESVTHNPEGNLDFLNYGQDMYHQDMAGEGRHGSARYHQSQMSTADEEILENARPVSAEVLAAGRLYAYV